MGLSTASLGLASILFLGTAFSSFAALHLEDPLDSLALLQMRPLAVSHAGAAFVLQLNRSGASHCLTATGGRTASLQRCIGSRAQQWFWVKRTLKSAVEPELCLHRAGPSSRDSFLLKACETGLLDQSWDWTSDHLRSNLHREADECLTVTPHPFLSEGERDSDVHVEQCTKQSAQQGWVQIPALKMVYQCTVPVRTEALHGTTIGSSIKPTVRSGAQSVAKWTDKFPKSFWREWGLQAAAYVHRAYDNSTTEHAEQMSARSAATSATEAYSEAEFAQDQEETKGKYVYQVGLDLFVGASLGSVATLWGESFVSDTALQARCFSALPNGVRHY